jgi:aromatic-L-amino-acid decarboxylase
VTKELVEQIIPNGASICNPGFSSYITTGGTTASTIAIAAASIASPQRYTLTAFNFIEELSLKWLAKMLSLDNMLGVYSSGGSVANLVALGAARQSAFEKIGIDPAAQGMTRSGSIYASGECHHTIQRSAGVLGLGRNCVKAVKCDARGRMDVENLEQVIISDIAAGLLPIAVVANAGSTNTGAIDPLLAIGKIANRYAIWFHVDGAYGLPGILDDRISHLYAGLNMADSVIVDPHKWLGAAVGIAATFVRDRDLLQRAFTQEPADYLEGSVEQNSSELNAAGLDTEQPEKDKNTPQVAHSLDSFGIPYFDYGVELSSPCRGIVVWAMLKEIGVQGLRERVIRHNDMSRYIAKITNDHPQLELLDEPTLSICCFRYVDESIVDLNRFNQALHRRLVRENNYMPSTTKVQGQLAIRPCYIGARHEPHQADGLICEILKLGLEMTASGKTF